MEKTIETQDVDFNGICFVNLVDFDMVYGHRNNRKGYAEAATTFDRQLGTFMERMRDDDILIDVYKRQVLRDVRSRKKDILRAGSESYLTGWYCWF